MVVEWALKRSAGCLNGFLNPINDIEIIHTERTEKGGNPNNVETYDSINRVWTIRIGDSGEAWAKSIGKLLAGKYPAKRIILDFSEIRPNGSVLSRYGWVSSGDTVISEEYVKICNILSKRADSLLTVSDINDIINHLGVIQTGRRGAEILLMDAHHDHIDDFINFKADAVKDLSLSHRFQSNNSIMYWQKPERSELEYVFQNMVKNGGGDPGFINGQAARRDCPWFKVFNPCVEAALANKGLCNLYEINLRALETPEEFNRVAYIVGRANYRQTLVNLNDGILQDQWHQNNQHIRLCGVSLTAGFSRQDITGEQLNDAKKYAIAGAESLAEELGLAKPKAVTLGKPGGTVPKLMGVESGNNAPKGKYIFNRIIFGKNSPEAKALKEAGYEVVDHPNEKVNVLVTFPVKYDIDDSLFKMKNGCLVPDEGAVDQLNRYKKMMVNWTQQNTSNTIEYEPEEVPEIIDWLLENWDVYKGVAFMFKNDYTRTAEECGFLYLPEQVVKEDDYNEYVSNLKPLDWNVFTGATNDLNSLSDGCEGGMCPVR